MRLVDPTAGRIDHRSNSSHPSLKGRASGLRFERVQDGHLLAWIRLADGQWRALVAIEMDSANHRTCLTIALYVPPDAISQKERTPYDK